MPPGERILSPPEPQNWATAVRACPFNSNIVYWPSYFSSPILAKTFNPSEENWHVREALPFLEFYYPICLGSLRGALASLKQLFPLPKIGRCILCMKGIKGIGLLTIKGMQVDKLRDNLKRNLDFFRAVQLK